MKGYLVALVNVEDMDQYKKYMALSPGIIAQYGGEFLTRGGRNAVVEGPDHGWRKVLVEFPSYDAALDCYNSAEYQAAIEVRKDAANAIFMIMEGV